jgi:hypothetical protein
MHTIKIKITSIMMIGLTLMLLMPKINIINIPGYHQGLRFDDLFLLAGFIYICTTKKLNIHYFPGKGLYFVFYVPLLFIGLLSSYAYGTTPLILTFKWIEYSIYFVLLYYASFTINKLRYVAFLYITINFILVTLQKSLIIGCYHSRNGYVVDCSGRTPGITGGAWELPITLVFMIVPLIFDINIRKVSKYFWISIVTTTVYITDTRTGIIALGVVLLLTLFHTTKNKIMLILILPIILLFLFSSERMDFLYTGKNFISNSVGSFKTAGYDYVANKQIDIGFIPLTMIARFQQWDSVLSKMKDVDYIFGKGLGFSGVFKEGMYVKILTDLGALGILFFFLYYYRLLKNHIILGIALGLSCLTIDALSASKIMFSFYFSLFYLKELLKWTPKSSTVSLMS